MSIKNVKVRFNLSKENDRKAYEYLQGAEVSYSKAVILLSADIWSCQKELQPKKLSSKGLYPPSERKRQKQTLLAAYYNLCNSPLHKHLPKRKKNDDSEEAVLDFLDSF